MKTIQCAHPQWLCGDVPAMYIYIYIYIYQIPISKTRHLFLNELYIATYRICKKPKYNLLRSKCLYIYIYIYIYILKL